MKELNFAEIGSKLREIRIDRKLTQESVAYATGVNVSHISNIETNKVKVSLTLLVNICNVLDTTVDYVLENEYHTAEDITEKELLNTIKSLEHDKKETLLRIANVL